jgi:hypothetical protein
MVPAFRLLLLLPLVLAGSVRRVERRTIARLKDAGANTSERAVLIENNGMIATFVHQRLEAAGALKPAANDRYYWNEAAYTVFNRRRRRRAVVVLAVLAIVFTVMYFRGVLQ